ncbi:MAG: SDR family oxidoreductase [Bacteroidales bacterium]|nr:SDR family oxidoreductase [Bacteroidales bacterium]
MKLKHFNNMKTAIITGATSGIGEACAKRLASEGWRLIITGRREDKLKKLVNELKEKFYTETLPLVFDVRDEHQTITYLSNLPETWKDIDLLINNAGLASGLEPLQDGDTEDWNKMIDTNIKGLLYVSKQIMPLMIERRKGHIINLGSIAGKEVYPNGVVYCATKHAVDAISKGMRLDLVPYGIKVSQICPGAVETEFSVVRFHGDKNKADNVYKGFTPLNGDDIADVIAYIVNLPDHVCINDIVVMPKAQASAYVTHKV